MDSLYYLDLLPPIRFDPISNITNVFFDDSNRQVFAVRSGGTTGVTVKGPNENHSITFCMENKGLIRSIKFSPDNKILAIQRAELSVEFIAFNENQPNANDVMATKEKTSQILGFVWIHFREVALISNSGVELYLIIPEKKQVKLIKSLNLTINEFAWCPVANFALLSSNNGNILTPVIIKQGTITKLPRLEMDDRSVLGRDVTLAQLYGTSAILLLRQTANRLLEIVVYLLNGPGLAPKKSHILKLGYSGRFAMSVVDDLVIAHHQASKLSFLFDIALREETDPVTGIVCHSPIVPGKSIKPCTLKVPGISLNEQTMTCDLYSRNWVLFQPNIIIDARLGCLWCVNLNLEPLRKLVTDRERIVEFLLQRKDGKKTLIPVLCDIVMGEFSNVSLPTILKCFDKLNDVYKIYIDAELQKQTGTPSSAKPPILPVGPHTFPRVLIDQSDMHIHVFNSILESKTLGKILLIYLESLLKHRIGAQNDLSRLIINDFVKTKKFATLQQLLNLNLLNESKELACFLLSLGNLNASINQMAMDMLIRLNATEIIIEVLLGQGKVIDALRLAKQDQNGDFLLARKYLEAAQKTNDNVIFYTVYNFFQLRNIRQRNSPDFLSNEQCSEYIDYHQKLFGSK